MTIIPINLKMESDKLSGKIITISGKKSFKYRLLKVNGYLSKSYFQELLDRFKQSYEIGHYDYSEVLKIIYSDLRQLGRIKTQKEFGKIIGVKGQAAVSKLNNGKITKRNKTLEKIHENLKELFESF